MSDSIPSLVATRYGVSTKDLPNDLPSSSALALTTLLSHKSVRHFKEDTPLPAGALDVILAAAQSAATSSNLQAWSVIVVKDQKKKDELAKLSGNQEFVSKAAVFLLWVGDLHRLSNVAATKSQAPGAALDYIETFLLASLDAGFAAQNAVVAAEALGLGGCYVGGARNHPSEVASLLGLPPRTVGLFGLALGVPHPEGTAAVKPRLPASEVVYYEQWGKDEKQKEHFDSYDKALDAFNASQNRSDQPTWTQRSTERVATEESMHGRHVLKQILNDRGFELK